MKLTGDEGEVDNIGDCAVVCCRCLQVLQYDTRKDVCIGREVG